MVHVIVSSKGQIALPAQVRHRLGLSTGAKLELTEDPSGIHLKVLRSVRRTDLSKLAGMVTAPQKGRPRRLASFDASALVAKKPK